MPYDPYRRLAAIILSGPWQRAQIEAALQQALKGRKVRSAAIAEEILARWPQPYEPGERALAELIQDAFQIRRRGILVTVDPPSVHQPDWAKPLGLPALQGPGDLADWLGISMEELHWLADCDGRLARDPDRKGHYEQTWLSKRSRGRRLVEAPLPRLKAAQRRLLSALLDLIPPHPDAFGFVRGRDCRIGAARHAGEAVVICFDLADFFPSIRASRVHAIFRTIGYPPAVTRFLTGLTATRTPPDIIAALDRRERTAWRAPHLPQGAPTSPALANLSARRLDVRLSALARRLGASYSRYADDITLSGDRGLAFDGAHPLIEMVSEIVRDEGFRLNPAKTRVQRRGTRQKVTGLVVNRNLNIPRDEYDRLKAILTNCVRHGPSGQNREGRPDFRAHLSGRVGWVEQVNPHRAGRLRALFERIYWRA